VKSVGTHKRGSRKTVLIFVAGLTAALGVFGAVYAVYLNTGTVFVALDVAIGTCAMYLLLLVRAQPPFSEVADAARRVADGEFDVRVDFGGRRDLVDLADAFNSMTEALRERADAASRTVAELSTLYEMSRALGSTLDLDAMLDATLDAAMRSFAVDSGYVVLRDPASGEIELRAWRGTGDRPLDSRAVRASMSEWVVRQGRPLIFNPSQETDAVENVDAVTGALAALCVPLVSVDVVIGAIAVGSHDRSVRFTGDDVRLLSTIANHVTIAVGNTELFANVQDAYLATVRALAAAVDAKEPYMRDHSGRVAVFARATAERMGLSHDQCTAIEMAAYLHDIGKIGISEQILRKPGPLTAEEMSTMRHHPLIGANILRPVTFPWSIAPVVRHHHEHFDGSGYPAGLKGEEIPLLARVLSVADAYEAMTADRPYRHRTVVDDAIAELRRCSGTDFDPRVVEAMIDVLTDMDATASGSELAALTVEPYEARAVFVAVADGMMNAYRKLGGPRLTSNLEVDLGRWLLAEAPAFALHDGHFSVAAGSSTELDGQLDEMRAVLGRLSTVMSAVTGPSLVDHFYGEAVESLTERLRGTAKGLALYRRP
jgi:putative nucleotidyltransferase with HDIG domain